MSQHNTTATAPIAIYYEHSEWFEPVFAELERRGVPYERLFAPRHRFDPGASRSPYSLVVNRMSPSAYTRGHGHAILYTLHYLAHLKTVGANVLNGYDAYLYEISKARQLGLFERLGLRYPQARVINDPAEAAAAAEGLTFPVVVKPNIGGSGAKIARFDTAEALEAAAAAGTIDLGLDHTALVQEYLPAQDNQIVRVEILNGELLYAIRISLTEDEFNLCPADYCRTPEQPDGDLCVTSSTLVEGYTPPAEIIEAVKSIVREANIEVGGVEYLVNARDGEVYYYDVNALSNFVANAAQVVGFDPFPRLVDFLLERAGVPAATAAL